MSISSLLHKITKKLGLKLIGLFRLGGGVILSDCIDNVAYKMRQTGVSGADKDGKQVS